MALEVANTILAQLGGSGRLSAMIGAKHLVGGERTLTFKFMGGANGANCVRVTLDPSDTYTVEFMAVRGTKVTPKGSFSDVYYDALKGLFEGETGLHLSL